MIPEILVIGDYYVDYIFTGVEKWPVPGQEVFGSALALTPGGTFIPAQALHRLGVPTVWAADLGNDELSDAILQAAEREGMDTSAYTRVESPRRRLSVAVTHDGDRGFISFRDPGERDDLTDVIRNRRPGFLHCAGLMLGDTWSEIVSACNEVGCRIIVDPQHNESTIDDPDLQQALASVEVFLPNEDEAMAMTGASDSEGAATILGAHMPVVVIKVGSQGALLHHQDETVHIAAPEIPEEIDTVGAGDCFDAGFVAAYMHGLPLKSCVELAVVCGSISVGGSGGNAAATLSELTVSHPHLVPWAN